MSLGISTDNHIKDNQKFLSGNYKKSIIFAMLSKSASMQVMRIFWVVLGSVSLALGVIGIFVPLLPTTPFLLLSAATYFRGSPRLYHWLLHHKYFGSYIRNLREERAIPLRAKILSITVMWLTIGHCVLLMGIPVWLRIVLTAIAVGVTIHILSYKTLKH